MQVILALTVTAATLVPSLKGQAFLADPLRFWTHDSAYAGSQTCKGCHAEIYQRQQASNHSRSLRPAKEVPQLTSGLPIERRDRASDSTLLLQLDSDGEVQLQSRRNSDQAAAVLEWAFGSGLKGITPIARTGDGHLVESRLTWYASLQDISFTTGSSRYVPATARESLGRRLTQKQVSECFGCHTTGYDRAREAPARDEMGVSCERCHGPGSEHIAAVRNGKAPKKIFPPGRMEGRRRGVFRANEGRSVLRPLQLTISAGFIRLIHGERGWRADVGAYSGPTRGVACCARSSSRFQRDLSG